MTRDESIALFQECENTRAKARAVALAEGRSESEAEDIAHNAAKDHWNAWANGLIAERNAMEEDGRWASEVEKQAWLSRATVDFSFCLFHSKNLISEKKDTEARAVAQKKAAKAKRNVESIQLNGVSACFDNFRFPWKALFSSACFTGDASFYRADFSGIALFDDSDFFCFADFSIANFSSAVSFDDATFTRKAYFLGATLGGDAALKRAKFLENVSFSNAAFSRKVHFDNATFSRDAYFDDAIFSRNVFFCKSTFGPKGSPYFRLATFEQIAQFDDAIFQGKADFTGVLVKRTFSIARATFERVPDFIQAHFEEAPRLDNMRVSLSQRLELLNEREACDLFARWRALKRLAIQAHDTDRELEFNAQEICAERAASYWPIPVRLQDEKKWLEAIRSFFGWLYGFFSNYGRSLFRPSVAWAIGIAVFAAFYLIDPAL